MLVLTRRIDEAIVIDGDIRVTVLGIKGRTVRLGIVAPEGVRVDRAEVHQRRAEWDTADPPVPASASPVSGVAGASW